MADFDAVTFDFAMLNMWNGWAPKNLTEDQKAQARIAYRRGLCDASGLTREGRAYVRKHVLVDFL